MEPAVPLAPDPGADEPAPIRAEPPSPRPTPVDDRDKLIAEPAPVPERARRRPTSSIGLGVGYTIPAAVDRLNTFAVRLRLANGIAFEPALNIQYAKSSAERDSVLPNVTADRYREHALSTAVRFPLRSRGPIDALMVTALGVARAYEDPFDANDYDETRWIGSLSWGVALDYWINRHIGVSLTAMNPVVLYDRLHAGRDITTLSSFSVTFAPTGSVLAFLYY